MFDLFEKLLGILTSLFSRDQLNQLFDMVFGFLLGK